MNIRRHLDGEGLFSASQRCPQQSNHGERRIRLLVPSSESRLSSRLRHSSRLCWMTVSGQLRKERGRQPNVRCLALRGSLVPRSRAFRFAPIPDSDPSLGSPVPLAEEIEKERRSYRKSTGNNPVAVE